MFSSNTQEMLRWKADLQAIEVEIQRRRFLSLHLPGRENERSLYIGSPAHLPPRFNRSLLFQPESRIEETTKGDNDRGENHLQLVANSNEERGYGNDLYIGQDTSLESTLPDSLFGSLIKSEETRQTESDTKQFKSSSSDQSS